MDNTHLLSAENTVYTPLQTRLLQILNQLLSVHLWYEIFQFGDDIFLHQNFNTFTKRFRQKVFLISFL